VSESWGDGSGQTSYRRLHSCDTKQIECENERTQSQTSDTNEYIVCVVVRACVCESWRWSTHAFATRATKHIHTQVMECMFNIIHTQ